MRTIKCINNSTIPALAGMLLLLGIQVKSQQSHESYKDIHCVQLIVKYDFLGQMNDVISMSDTFPIFYYKNFIVYALRQTVSTERNNITLNTSLKYKYYIYKKGDTHGYLYDSLSIAAKKYGGR
jgi:hypothetical protein